MVLGYVKSEFADFLTFLTERNIMGAGIGLIIALQVNSLFLDFVDDIIKPVASKVVSEDININYVTILGVKLKVGHLIISIINFIITMIFIFYLYRLSKSTPKIINRVYGNVYRIK